MKNKVLHNQRKKEWRGRNKIKVNAANYVRGKVRDGKIIKPKFCEECKTESKIIHGHHDDYSKRDVVRWLCPKCHTDWHKLNGNGKNG